MRCVVSESNSLNPFSDTQYVCNSLGPDVLPLLCEKLVELLSPAKALKGSMRRSLLELINFIIIAALPHLPALGVGVGAELGDGPPQDRYAHSYTSMLTHTQEHNDGSKSHQKTAYAQENNDGSKYHHTNKDVFDR